MSKGNLHNVYEIKKSKISYGGSKIMGMSASQMRYIMISGEKSDVEFQGQQINQQRTTLATQTSAYNSQLLNLTVPTPPSSDQFQTTSYSFTMGNDKSTVTGTTYDKVSKTYTVNYTQDVTKAQAQTDNKFKCTRDGSDFFVAGTKVALATLDNSTEGLKNKHNISVIEEEAVSPYRLADGTALTRVVTDNTSTKYNADTIANLTTAVGGTIDAKETYYSYVDADGNSVYTKGSELKANAGVTDGVDTYSVDANGNRKAGTTTANAEQFYVYSSGGTTYYLTATDLNNLVDGDTDGKNLTGYTVDETATVKESYQMTGTNISWSSSGRMTAITDADGNNYSLSVSTAKDDTAYEDAYNEYEFAKNEYSNKMDQINAQIDIVQTQDKKLELKLQDLDTKQKALSTEMDSVKKVIDKNIEASFKAFA